MKLAQGLVAALVLASEAVAFKNHRIRRRASSRDDDEEPPAVPSYNVSLPVDHFNTQDTRVFNNRYWVNDTYYKPGGPVILYDFGESGVSDGEAAWLLSGYQGIVSAPLELAKNLSGVVVGWEHRYYGYSHPFEVTDEDSVRTSGIPLGGAADYAYLSVEQALEDVVVFANQFNKTQLAGNAVISGANGTQHLGPYHTPWLFVGGSYPGSRAVWIRQRNPEVIYASWASSAPVELRADGSAYYNSIYRALPKNCTTDVQAVMGYIDRILSGNNQSAILDLKTAVYVAAEGVRYFDEEEAEEWDGATIAQYLTQLIWDLAQSFGVAATAQKFCDHVESFDVKTYLSNSSIHSSDRFTRSTPWLYINSTAKPSDKGIVASNGDQGEQIGLVAYLWGYYQYQENDYEDLFRNATTSDSITRFEDLHSWEWQVLSQMGMVNGANASSPYHLGSKFLNASYAREEIEGYFDTFAPADFPAQANLTYPLSFGGWNMKPSNVLFTNGEFDPWRAYSVMSLDTELGAPQRKVVQDVPKCGQPPAGTDLFGLLYGGATHAEDIATFPDDPTGSIDFANPPIKQGTELFIKAYNAWLPCFNTSRQPTGGGNGGSGGGSGGSSGGSGSGGGGDGKNSASRPAALSGIWAIVGVTLYFLL